MRSAKRPLLAFAAVIAPVFSAAQPAFAQDGAAIYKTKCAGCHGAEGQGKIGPAVKGSSLTADQIAGLLVKGDESRKPPHKKALNGVSADDARAVASFVKALN